MSSTSSKIAKTKEGSINVAVEYIDQKILAYFKCMSDLQKEVNAEYEKDPSFKFYRLNEMDTYIKVANVLSINWSKECLSEHYEKATSIWLRNLYPISKRVTLDKRDKIVKQGRILAALAFLNGQYHLGLTFLFAIHQLLPKDSFVYALIIKWLCLLHEFEMFRNFAVKMENDSELASLLDAAHLHITFFETSKYEEQLNIVEQAHKLKIQIEDEKPPTFFGFFALQLLYNLLVAGSNLHNFDIEKYGDFIFLSRKEHDRTKSILLSRFKTYSKKDDANLIVFDGTEMPDSSVFLKSVAAVCDHFDCEQRYLTAMFETGDVWDAENKVLYSLYTATKLGIPSYIIQCLNFLYTMKLRMKNDQNKLKGLGAMMTLLLGKVNEKKW